MALPPAGLPGGKNETRKPETSAGHCQWGPIGDAARPDFAEPAAVSAMT
jgi:hypothetical protein